MRLLFALFIFGSCYQSAQVEPALPTEPIPIASSGPASLQAESLPAASAPTVIAEAPPRLPEKEEEMFLNIAAKYTSWMRVDEAPNIAPGLCRMPRPGDYGKASQVRLSDAAEKSPHGRKLYYLFAKDKYNYLALRGAPKKLASLMASQVIVKESWSVKTMAPSSQPGIALPSSFYLGVGPMLPPITRLTVDGETLETDQKSGLYIMAYVGEKKPDTDAGWWYATLTPDGKTITASGRIKSCMGCHEKAPYGRLFGLKQ